MKQFKKLGAKCRKYAQRTLALGLVLCFLLSFQGTHVVAAGNGELASLSVSGVSVIDFDPTVTNYTVKIPQTYTDGVADVLDVPTVTAVPVDGAQVDIVRPAAVGDGDITITVTPDGGIPTVYTLSLEVVGKNLYTNSGFEESGVPYNQGNGTATVVQTNPYHGSNCLEIKFKGDPGWMLPRVTLEANKTYLSSRMVRKTDNTVIDGSTENEDIYYRVDTFTGNLKHYPHGGIATTASNTAVFPITPEDSWKRYDTLIMPTTDWEDKQMYHTKSWSAWNYIALDNCFLGELVVSDIEVTDVSGAELGKLVKPEEGTDSVSLGANFYNQLGTTTGLEGMEVSRWELAEDYPGVTLSNTGVLTYDITAPSTVTVRAYGTMG